MFIIKNLSYKINHINSVFENLSFIVNDNEKIGIVGPNGIGKSILLELLIGKLQPYNGEILDNNLNIAYFPQKFNDLDFSTVASVFNLEKQVLSLKKVEENIANIQDYENLENNWDCVDKIMEKMKFFDLEFEPLRDFNTLSGGEKVKLILSSIIDKNTNFLVLDEPTNNMDYESKQHFYNFIKNWRCGLIMATHDRELLNLVNKIYELRKVGISDTKLFIYGGNFEYWKEQKEIEMLAIERKYENSIKNIQSLKINLQNKKELTDKKRIQGEKKFKENKGAPKIIANSMRSRAENSNGDYKKSYNDKIDRSNKNLENIQSKMEIKSQIYFKFLPTKFINKLLLKIENLNFSYGDRQIFNDFSLLVNGGDRISIEGKNGSGKTTLLKIINNQITNYHGIVRINSNKIAYLDQNCDILQNNDTILENIMTINPNISEKACRDILAQFLFRTDAVYKKILDLSGGEKLRVTLACILLKEPELLLLDEPTNNMDLDSIEILENILNQYNGALIIISHDVAFKENVEIKNQINL